METNPTDHKAIITSLEKELAGLDAEKEALLARINARRTGLEKLIKEHKRYLDLWSGAGSFSVEKPEEVTVITVPPDPNAIPKNAFRSLSFLDATLKYLHMVKTGKTTRELGEAFIQGGKKAKPTKYYFDSIRTALNRRGRKNGIVKIGEQWWLDEFAPNAPRRVLWSELTSLKDVSPENADEESPGDEESLSNTKTHILLRAIHQNGSKGATAAEIYENINNAGHWFDRSDVPRILAKQVSRGRVRKDGLKAHLTAKGLEAIGEQVRAEASAH